MEYSAADLCSRCASIPWDSLEQGFPETCWEGEGPTLRDLQTSSCRLCRLIMSAIIPTLRQDAHSRSIVHLECDRWITDERKNGCLGWVKLVAEPGGFAGQLMLATEEPDSHLSAMRYFGSSSSFHSTAVTRRRRATHNFRNPYVPIQSDPLEKMKRKVSSTQALTEEPVKKSVMAWSIAVPKRVDFSWIRLQLEACKASHKFCAPEISPQLLNLRVIDCFEKVVEVAPIGCLFVALSYVWGELSANSYILGSEITFPPTIEDAVRSTRELGYRYLWVDRYVRRHKHSIVLN